ncbi:NAD-glutamate dehydrogenase [Oleispira antarctica]|uniref:NAD-glutamate dehydrogenase n=1 Tax=Oleispira antarctica TaxID=188908 RepID=A0A1Y5HW89_OLEAN|nr:NAD-glutamate dehydrogenase [Oleispira antarctica]
MSSSKPMTKLDLTALNRLIDDRNDKVQAQRIKLFAELYYAEAPVEDLNARNPEDLYGATVSCWLFIQENNISQPKVRVFNPDFEAHGWQSTHTVIEVLAKEMPFLIDSVRLELNRRQMSIHAINSCVAHLERDGKHKKKGSSPLFESSDKSQAEAIIYIEVDRHTESDMLDDLAKSLISILHEVSHCVEDFTQLTAKVNQVAAELGGLPCDKPKKEIKEAQDFLSWLSNDHFTFLGCDEFTIENKGDKTFIVRDEGHDLGIFRFHKAEADRRTLEELPAEIQSFVLSSDIVNFFKSGSRSRVHRPAYPDYVVIKRFNKKGEVIGGIRFMGLYTSIVYIESPNNIPLIRQKLQQVRKLAGFDKGSHSGKELNRILEVYPRDELIQSSSEQLYNTALGILNIQERRQTRAFLRKGTYGKFLYCMVYTPRDIYNTELRTKIQGVLEDACDPDFVEFNTNFSESILARTHFVLRLKNSESGDVNHAEIERKIQQAARSWGDDLHTALVEQVGEEKGNRYHQVYRHAFPAGYREDFGSRTAVADIQHIEDLRTHPEKGIAMSFYRELEEGENQLRFKLFNLDDVLPLSDVLPILENLGLRVIGEHPYGLQLDDGRKVWIHNFLLEYTLAERIDMQAVKCLFQETFKNIWHGHAESDGFNKLVLGSEIGWRDIAMLRAYARYMKQTRFGISETYIAATLTRYIEISRLLVKAFEVRFGLHVDWTEKQRDLAFNEIEREITEALDDVEQLNEDRIVRRFLELIKATLRTNFNQSDEEGNAKDYIAFKLDPHQISDMPLPRPMFEIFVYSPRVEGVHLRGGKVARGGLRWSDRNEDFRTEVLGLVKAQQVKNAVIVPVGAKGGFVAKNLSSEMSRDEWLEEGIACYKIFISSLLDVTDNLVDGAVVPPLEVVRHDDDDVYLVVAADKGTATFSDISNGISLERDFWLGDAFASGGSIGYDHKKMGITARGAWVSVQRHFRERGLNVQEEDFTVVGVGDMAGDVFGNGMLLSQHIRLTAAFNHMHIFVDPNPDSAPSYIERKRMFEMPRSTWDDYDKSLISKGGAVFSRSAKSIKISPEMKERFDIKADALPPTELIKALLLAPVDLLWNGGIGTYIKGSSETHADVGDKATDAVRINGNQVRAKVVGEGGNLGMTQLGRVEFALANGSSYTDFIDNAGGVDCSDHEVNIKIMLNEIVASGDMTMKQRNQLFMDMTDAVSDLVLGNNYRQTQAIALAHRECEERMDEYVRLIHDFEEAGKLNRALEYLPDEETIAERKVNGQGLTKPELSVLISYAKADLKEQLNLEEISQDPYLCKIVETAFPQKLVDDYNSPVMNHKLRSEIVATQLANDLVNYMGITFVNRLTESTGATVVEVARAYVAARDVFGLHDLWAKIEQLDYQIPANVQADMMSRLMRLVRRASRWFLRNRRTDMDVATEVESFKASADSVRNNLSQWLQGSTQATWQGRFDQYSAQGVSDEVSALAAGTSSLFSALGIIEASHETARPVERVAEAYFCVGETLSLNWFLDQINNLEVNSHWQALAREAFRDDMDWQLRSLTVSVLSSEDSGDMPMDELMSQWKTAHPNLVSRWQRMLDELRASERVEYAMYSVALRELLDLAQASKHQSADCG